MRRSSTHSFVLTLPLVAEPWQRDRLNKDFRVACSIQNTVTHGVYTRYKQMIKTRRYRKALAAYRLASKGQKGDCAKKLQQIQYEYGLTEFQIEAYAKGVRNYFRGQINSQITQRLAHRVYESLSKLLYGTATRMHYCRSEDFSSIEGKSNQTGIRFFGDTVFYKKMQFKAVVHHEDPYIQQALGCRVKYCRIKRLMIRGKYKFYVQLILEGDPPIKIRSTGELKRPLGTGRIGLDIGTQTLAIYAKDTVRLVELADRVQSIERELRRINRAMDRSRRANNPQFFAEDGTYIRRKNGEPRREWKNSNHYEKLCLKRRELYRKQAAVRKQQHRELAAQLRALGDEVFIEPMSFKGLQRKSKQCTKTKADKNKSRKRFGKSIANRAPAMLVSMIDILNQSCPSGQNKSADTPYSEICIPHFCCPV